MYHDVKTPPQMDTLNPQNSDLFKWGFSLVALWSSQLSSADTTTLDISPAGIGNIANLPTEFKDYPDFYTNDAKGVQGPGHTLNPYTGQPYATQKVKCGDYARVVAEFWADGPDSETPPGHWFTLLNYVYDHPLTTRNVEGVAPMNNKTRWEIYGYLLMGAAMHDVAISTWAQKGYYDYIRPVSALRYMADQGQSSDPDLPNYNPRGIPLVDGYIELVKPTDAMAVDSPELVNKIKVRAWRGHTYIDSAAIDTAGVGWILMENWWPYQRPSFVTPPFAGYISGHSTFSSAAADILEILTGSAFFPGGMGEWDVEKNEFLVFEEGSSESMKLQWATYKDAASQSGLSRIWGGIHPPFDDMPGRHLGQEIGLGVFQKARDFLMLDRDGDGYSAFEDWDDTDTLVHPGATELCDNRDNDQNGEVDDNLPQITFYLDNDQDSFGNKYIYVQSCYDTVPAGYVRNNDDCADNDSNIHPNSEEIPNNEIDENCDGIIGKVALAFGPNPAENYLAITYDSDEDLEIELIDNQGRTLVNEISPKDNFVYTIDLRGTAPGLYVLRVTSATSQENLITERVIKVDF